MRILLSVIGSLLVLSSAAHAAGSDVAIYAGKFGLFQDSKNRSLPTSKLSSNMVGVEYRFKDQYNGLRPTVGAFANTDGGVYGYGGAYWDLPLNTAPFVISPGFAIGAYNQGSSKDLGSVLEFRSTMEVSYKMDSGQRFGLQFSHLSNAGLGSTNLGVETWQLMYSHPF